MRRSILIAFLLFSSVTACATTTNYSEPWTSSLDSWSYTQSSCSGTCTDALLTSDGNPADGVSNNLVGRNKAEVGYWSRALTWTAMGVPSGDTVDTVDGQWDDKAVQTAVACTSASTMGIQIYDSGNASAVTASDVEPAINVAGDTSAWTNHNPTGAVSVTSSNSAGSTVTLRLNSNPASGNNSSAACELRGDNFKLTIVSHAPSTGGGPKRIHVSKVIFGPPAPEGFGATGRSEQVAQIKQVHAMACTCDRTAIADCRCKDRRETEDRCKKWRNEFANTWRDEWPT